MNRTIKIAFSSAVLLIAISAPAMAASITEEVIVTAEREPEPRAEFPGSLGLLDENELERANPVHIQQVLNRIPGVNLQRGDGQEYLPAIRSPVFTGPGACGSILMLENGVPIRPAGFCNINGLFETHSEQAERIEVLKGPATTFFGSNALHGLVNIINPAPLDSGGRLAVDAGEDDYYRLRYRYGGERLAYSFTGTTYGGYRDQAYYDQQKLSLRYRADVDAYQVTSDVTAINLNQETAGYVTGQDAYRSWSKVRENENPEAYRDVKAVRLSSRIEGDDGLQITPYFRHSKMEFLQHFLPGKPLEENGHNSVGLLSQKHYALSPRQLLIVGLDLEYAHVWLKQSQRDPTVGSPFLQATVPAGKQYDFKVDSTSAALFGHLRHQFTDRLEGDLGLRLEHRRYDYDNRMLAGRTKDDGTPCGFGGCRYSRPADRDDTFRDVSSRAALNMAFTDNLRGYVAVAKAFRAPQITELYRLQREQQVADLDSESLFSIEAGLIHRGDNFEQELALYRMRKKDIILRTTDFFNVSDGKTSHLGIEWRGGFALDDHWRLNAALAYAKHQYENNPSLSLDDIEHNDIDTAPRKSAFAEILYQNPAGLEVGLEVIYSGRYYLEPENDYHYPGQTLSNLRVAKTWDDRFVTTVRVNNLGDKSYAERADYTSFSGPRYFPGRSRNVVLSAEYRF